MARKHDMFKEQDFEDILKQEKKLYDAKSKDFQEILKVKATQSKAKNNWGKGRAHTRARAKVKSKLNAFFRRKQYQRRKSESTIQSQETEETTTTEPETASTSHVPSRIRRLSIRRDMEEFVLPPREKSESYINMYTWHDSIAK